MPNLNLRFVSKSSDDVNMDEQCAQRTLAALSNASEGLWTQINITVCHAGQCAVMLFPLWLVPTVSLLVALAIRYSWGSGSSSDSRPAQGPEQTVPTTNGSEMPLQDRPWTQPTGTPESQILAMMEVMDQKLRRLQLQISSLGDGGELYYVTKTGGKLHRSDSCTKLKSSELWEMTVPPQFGDWLWVHQKQVYCITCTTTPQERQPDPEQGNACA